MRIVPLAAALLLSSTASAQTFPTQDPVIKRIYSIGMDSSATQTLAHVLFDSLGPRLMGTPNIKGAEDWLVKLSGSRGIDAREDEYGTWRGRRRGDSHIHPGAPPARTLQRQLDGDPPCP